MEKLLTIKELSEVLNLNCNTIYKLTYKNMIPYIKIGRSVRLDKEKILTWLDKNSNSDTILTEKVSRKYRKGGEYWVFIGKKQAKHYRCQKLLITFYIANQRGQTRK